MQFIKLITLTVVLLSTSLAFAEDRAISKEITENPDGSFTIYEPRMLRDNKEMPIYGNGSGTCALYGFNKYLDNTRIRTEQTVAQSIWLNPDGSYYKTLTNRKPYKEITCFNTKINDDLSDLYVFYVHGDGGYTHRVYSDVKCREGKYCPCEEGQKSCKAFLKEYSDINFLSKVKNFAESCVNCDVLIMYVRPRWKDMRIDTGSKLYFKSTYIAQDLFFYRDGVLQQQKGLSSVNDSAVLPLPVIGVFSLFSRNNSLKKETDYFLEQSLHKKYRYQLAFFFGHKMPDKEKKGYFRSNPLVKFSAGHFLSGLNRLSQGINQEHKPFDVLFLGQCLSTIETIYEVQKKNTASLVLASPELIAFDALSALDLKSLWTRTHQNKNSGATSKIPLKKHISSWMQDTFSAKTPESILDKIFVQTSLSLFDMEHLKEMENSLEEAVQIMNENNQLSQEKREEAQMIAEGTQENAVSFSELPSFNCAPIEKLGPFLEEASPAVLNYTYSGKSLLDILSDITNPNKKKQPSKLLTSHSGWSCL